jgi:hypothetical protein
MTAVVASQPQPEPSMPGTSGKDTGKTVSPKDVHILLVDDERLSRVVVGNLLRKCSYQGFATMSHDDALRSAIFCWLSSCVLWHVLM